MTGPLTGVKIVEMNAIGPAPMAAMILADMGADVIRVDRLVAGFFDDDGSQIGRGRRSVAIDLKKPGGAEVLLKLIAGADVLIEGFRPGVMERLGLGPDACLTRNPKLVYGRMTGWGQTGPLASSAGHDLNYISLSGVVNAMGYSDRAPTPPLHIVGDMGGGAMFLVAGVLAALWQAKCSGKGQVVDAAICDGATLLASMYYEMRHTGKWSERRQANLLDGGTPFYGCFTCSDGKFISIGPLEPQFYKVLVARCGLVEDQDFKSQYDPKCWPEMRLKLAQMFLTRTRDEWCALLEGTEACFSPVLDFDEAPFHAHNVARKMFFDSDGVAMPSPAPRFSRTPSAPGKVVRNGANTLEVLKQIGLTYQEIEGLRSSGAIL